MTTTTTFKGIGFLLLLAMMAAGTVAVLPKPAAIGVAGHAVGNHAGDLFSSMDIYYMLEAAALSGGRGPCERLIVASCPLAKCQDAKSCRRGEPSPQYKAFCQLTPGAAEEAAWGMGIFGVRFGIDNAVYVTGYVLSYQAAQANIKRDKCLQADITILQDLFGPKIRPSR